MTGDGRVIFDENKLRAFATELRQLRNPEQLRAQLLSGLAGPKVFGTVDGGPAAATRLSQSMNSLLDSLERIGVDTAELASNAIAAADQALSAAQRTARIARGGGE